MKRRLLDETGQMSVFVALIFQVLFVFFAMVVNIGLIVHDKINLQNAVDLGAYYAAQRQAEILNEIAHINYQIRQDYKLMTWRYRVLGTLGRQTSPQDADIAARPPVRTPPGYPLQDVEYALLQNEQPSVCIANVAWGDVMPPGTIQENDCFRAYNNPPQLTPVIPPAAPFVPGVLSAFASSVFSNNLQQSNCKDYGVLNWRFTMQILYAYKLAIATRKQMIFRLRRNLVDPNFKDRNNQSVREGVLATIRKNLTKTNRERFDDQYFEVYNGLSHPECVGPNGNGDRALVEIPINPFLIFTNNEPNCTGFQQTHPDLTGLDPQILESMDPGGIMRSLMAEPNIQGEQYPEHSSLGFEKNPWCMAYVGVHARSSPRKPFAPLGKEVQLVARGFAQPFGGRIGPWYRNAWNKGSLFSDGPERIDPLTSPRYLNGTLDGNDLDRIPNFSRYPGDQLGMKSRVALGAQRHIIGQFYTSGPNGMKLRPRYYVHIDSTPTTGDVLAYDPNDPPTQPKPEVTLVRQAELSAVSPDLFDITYYSIDPNFYQNYWQKGVDSGKYADLAPIRGLPARAISDIGSRLDNPQMMARNIEVQIENAFNGGNGVPAGLDPSLLAELRYHVTRWTHLLTGWTLPKVQVFTFPEAQFGNCEKAAPPEVMIPGKCAQNGGRTGYSVRMLSRDYLLSDKFFVGGDGVAPNSILNPPDPSF